MKISVGLVAAVSVSTLIAVGCETKKAPPTAGASVLEVGPKAPARTASSSTPVYTPPTTPVYVPPPAPASDQWATTTTPELAPAPAPTRKSKSKLASPAVAHAAPSADDASYTVKKGDTLYKIAKDRYGDVKMVSRITAANPGMDANKLKVGQRIVLPST